MSERVRIGVLAIQGDIEAHQAALERLGVESVRVLREKQLDDIAGLVIPGGESTTIAKGLTRLNLWEPLRNFAAAGFPILGTCAGAILVARRVEDHTVDTLGLLDVVASRNAYGTQVDSFSAPADPDPDPDLDAEFRDFRCVFIRAPQLEVTGPRVEVLMRVDRRPVLVRQGPVIAATFHPELTQDSRVHALLMEAASGAR